MIFDPFFWFLYLRCFLNPYNGCPDKFLFGQQDVLLHYLLFKHDAEEGVTRKANDMFQEIPAVSKIIALKKVNVGLDRKDKCLLLTDKSQ